MFIYCEDCNAIYREYYEVATKYDTRYVRQYEDEMCIYNNDQDSTIVNSFKMSNCKIGEVFVPGDFSTDASTACKFSSKHKVHWIDYNPKDHTEEEVEKLFSLFEGPVLRWYSIEKHCILLNTKTLAEIFEIRRLLGISYFVKGDNKL